MRPCARFDCQLQQFIDEARPGRIMWSMQGPLTTLPSMSPRIQAIVEQGQCRVAGRGLRTKQTSFDVIAGVTP